MPRSVATDKAKTRYTGPNCIIDAIHRTIIFVCSEEVRSTRSPHCDEETGYNESDDRQNLYRGEPILDLTVFPDVEQIEGDWENEENRHEDGGIQV